MKCKSFLKEKRYFVIFIYILLSTVLYACAPVISPTVLGTVDQTITFEALLQNPDVHKGKTVLLGGTIIKTINLPDQTLIEVLQQPLSTGLMPESPETTQGRFLVQFKGFEDPAVHYPGRLITVVGEVIGSQTRPVGETTYNYPVIAPKEYYLWRRFIGAPAIHIGIGVGTTF